MKMWKEFKEFMTRGNVVDLAIGIIIGSAFGKIVTSLVNDVIMPPIGLLLGRVDFSNLFINLSGQSYSSLSEAKSAGAPTINIGVFINTVLDFIIIGFVIFLMVRAINKIKRQPLHLIRLRNLARFVYQLYLLKPFAVHFALPN